MKTSIPRGFSDAELKTLQEMKIDRDFKYQIGQSVQRISEDQKELQSKQDRLAACLYSDHKDVLIEFENLKEAVRDTLLETEQRVGDIETKISKFQQEFNSFRQEIKTAFLTRQEFFDEFVPDVQKLDELQKRVEQRNEFINLLILNIRSQFRQDLESLKQELTPKVPEIDPVKQQLDERFQVFKVDFDGLVREIGLLKQAVTYDQKKFENIYTLIERMKEGKK